MDLVVKSLDLVSLEDWYRYKHHIPVITSISWYWYMIHYGYTNPNMLIYQSHLWILVLYMPFAGHIGEAVMYSQQDWLFGHYVLVGDRSVCKILSQYLPLASRIGTRKVIRANTNKPVFAFTLQYAKIGMIVAKFTMLRKTV